MNFKGLANLYKVDRKRLSKLVELGYETLLDGKSYMKNDSFNKIKEIVEYYRDNETTMMEVQKMFGVGSHQLKRYLEIFGVNKKMKVNYNRNIFKVIDTPDKAYWLGFILADGGIYQNELRIKIGEKDRKHLEKFIKFIDGDETVKIQEEIHSNTGKTLVKVVLCCRELVDDLAKYNILPNKSCKEIPYELPEELKSHYLRGFFDGDGCITSDLSSISFVGSKYMMEYLKDTFTNLGCYDVKILTEKSYFRVKWHSKDDKKKIVRYLYNNSTKENRLTRKVKLANAIIKL